MTPPRVVIFDLGKVLLDFDYGISIRRLAEDARADVESIRALLLGGTLLERYESGGLSSEAFHAEFARATGYSRDLAAFRGVFADIFSPIEPMIELAKGLRTRGLRTWILSNTNEIAVTHIRRQYPFFQGFEGFVFSYEHGCMKPAAPLYRVAERLTGAAGAEVFYLDDRPENVETARHLGWRACTHESVETSIRACRDAGLPVD